MTRIGSPSAPQGGFMLLEALIAILIFSVGILSMVGLQSMATRYSTDAKFRSTAGYLVSKRMSEIWIADRSSILTAFEETDAPLADLPGGKRTVTVTGDVMNGYTVNVTIKWTMPGDSKEHQHVAETLIHDRCDVVGC